jgi:hypothetical protein
MNELRVDIGGSTSGFAAATERTKVMAKALQAELSGLEVTMPKISHAGGGHTGQAGIIRETLVLIRELSRGNFTKMAGSASILAQKLGALKGGAESAASASKYLADSYALLYEKQVAIARAAAIKADASAAAIAGEGEEAEATLASAVADEAKAVAARNAAAATGAKAEAAQAAAAAEVEETTATGAAIGVMGTIVGVISAIIVVFAIWWGKTKLLTNALSGIKLPDFDLEYIAKHLQSVNAVAEGWKQINVEVTKSIELYNSANAAARRVSDATKEHFDHANRMLDIEKENAIVAAGGSSAKKKAIEVDFAQKNLDLEKDRNQAEQRDKENAAASLEIEGKNKKKQADSIEVNSKEHDENILKDREGKAKAAQEYLKALADPTLSKKAGEFFATGLGTNGASKAEIEASKRDGKAAAVAYIKSYHEYVDQNAANDEKRKKKEELVSDAAKSLGQAATIRLEIKDDTRTFNQKSADDADEANEKLKKKDKQSFGVQQHVDSLSSAGLFTSAVTLANPLLQVANSQLTQLQAIANNTKPKPDQHAP